MIKVLFFAQVRELVACDELSLPCDYASAEALRAALCERGDKWVLALEAGKLLVAVNQTLVPLDTPLHDGDEVAFFPPVTGG
ncbi:MULTISPECIES: molybdopterin synthase sulfur carrier subunit [Aeromonas]|uniref:molybdopterin synthase sulfur carrier subunit n=1 Tax=Aeromonas TaxID=642 RepID=UPI00191D96FF|nr:molybdopterin synthase sulfur carrier subunit [Aeromonas dhakensis]MBL0524519.1 molybdopterin synthase sulfur carrier subunit [Aeromonas dhakensis]MDD9208595.1 molybdopterin synthase sulfur carrier subunit [Aeromonas dhakensis]BEE09853.1 molybdopterin synthase sulfur carrier subunit [Aeromonas dhakensis]BEE26735.1 molybdopterin synthase sulfur carrier subunit [Aeromonas dhakensis]HDX8374615.1 molybdopterin synthase sulfur carrier subunit [Aeromonas dhakensis]